MVSSGMHLRVINLLWGHGVGCQSIVPTAWTLYLLSTSKLRFRLQKHG